MDGDTFIEKLNKIIPAPSQEHSEAILAEWTEQADGDDFALSVRLDRLCTTFGYLANNFPERVTQTIYSHMFTI